MAIDTGIYNQPLPKTPDLAGAYAKGLELRVLGMRPEQIQAEIEATKQSISASKTAEAGNELENKLREQAAKDNAWVAANGKNHLDVNGKVNYASLARAATEAGVSLPSVQKIHGADLLNSAAVIANKKGEIANASDITDFVNKGRYTASNLVGAALKSGMGDEEAAALMNRYTSGYENFLPDSSKFFEPVTGATVRKTVAAGMLASMSPLEQENLKLQQAAQGKTFADDLYSGVGRDKDSDISKKVRADYVTANPGSEAAVAKLSAYDISRLPNGSASIVAASQAATLTGTERLGSAAKVNALTVAQRNLNSGADAVKEVTSSVSGKTMLGEKVNSLIQKYAKSNPKIKQLEDSIQQYEQATGRKINTDISLSGIEEVMRKAAEGISPDITGAKKGTQAKLAPSDLSPRIVKMISPTGKFVDVPESEVEEAKFHEFKLVGSKK